MKKEILNFDFTNGTTVSEDDVSFYFNVINDDALFIQFVRIYFEEVEKKLYVLFDIKNKFEQNILVKFGRDENEDGETIESLEVPSILIKKNELKQNVIGYNKLGDLERSLYIEIKVFNEAQTEIVRHLGFNIKFFA
ncbi:hypothetical protein [Solibacillus isronensis]|uniref:hypothetical protein n=1 Tax=Solibacillus isronensis TaxID=412383 RepID=UPI0009A82BA2|nr:hypothetical protein [Solibacillus isronensis]